MIESTDAPAPIETETPEPPARPPCPAPAKIRAEVEKYDREARVGTYEGPRYKMTYRIKGEGPPLILVPGLASTYRVYSLLLNTLANRFQTITYDYPGEHPDDGAKLGKIRHDDFVDDLFGLIEHLNLGRVFLLGLSFGSTITLKALKREPRRFPKAVIQGAFAHRNFTRAERVALFLGRRVKGNLSKLPLRKAVLEYNSKSQYPRLLMDRWDFYVEQNGLSPIAGLSHRVDCLQGLDLRPVLKDIPVDTLVVQGNEDRIVNRTYFDELKDGLPKCTAIIVPQVGHQAFLTHAELFAKTIDEYLLPCAPEGCPNHHDEHGSACSSGS